LARLKVRGARGAGSQKPSTIVDSSEDSDSSSVQRHAAAAPVGFEAPATLASASGRTIAFSSATDLIAAILANRRRRAMSKDNFNKFCTEYIPQHPELGLGTDNMTPDAFAKVALVEGPKAGFSFTKSEIDEVFGAMRQAQLSDNQLDAVSGGAMATGLLSSAHKASVNGTAMCYSSGATSEEADTDWMFIKGEFDKGE
jgi:hypothetical protein